MPTTLHIASTFYITPFIDMSSAEFIERYKQGVHWQLYGWRVHGEKQAQEPLSVSFLVNKLHTIAKLDYFDGYQDQ